MNRLNRTFEDHSHDQYYNNIVILSCLHFYAVDESRVASSLCYLLSMIMRRVIMRYMVNALFFFLFWLADLCVAFWLAITFGLPLFL